MIIEGTTFWFAKTEVETLLRTDPEILALLGHMSFYDEIQLSACLAEAAAIEEFKTLNGRTPEHYELVQFQDGFGQRYLAVETDENTIPSLKIACELISSPDYYTDPDEEPEEINMHRKSASLLLKDLFPES